MGDFAASALIGLVGGPFTVALCAGIVGVYRLYLLIARPTVRSV
jgi:hypothetical protein